MRLIERLAGRVVSRSLYTVIHPALACKHSTTKKRLAITYDSIMSSELRTAFGLDLICTPEACGPPAV